MTGKRIVLAPGLPLAKVNKTVLAAIYEALVMYKYWNSSLRNRPVRWEDVCWNDLFLAQLLCYEN